MYYNVCHVGRSVLSLQLALAALQATCLKCMEKLILIHGFSPGVTLGQSKYTTQGQFGGKSIWGTTPIESLPQEAQNGRDKAEPRLKVIRVLKSVYHTILLPVAYKRLHATPLRPVQGHLSVAGADVETLFGVSRQSALLHVLSSIERNYTVSLIVAWDGSTSRLTVVGDREVAVW